MKLTRSLGHRLLAAFSIFGLWTMRGQRLARTLSESEGCFRVALRCAVAPVARLVLVWPVTVKRQTLAFHVKSDLIFD
ncbi:hypothetical protein H4582DRAFT_1933937 [Lactarius indigo]|nr:hypothetical protein H4582DRAFT_1933937 [Lactarius indigo]